MKSGLGIINEADKESEKAEENQRTPTEAE